MSFKYPMLLWLLLTIPLLAVYLWRRNKRQGISYSHLPLVENLPVSYRQKWMWLTTALPLLALAGMIVILTQPYREVSELSEQQEGIAIAIVLDVSSSMNISMEMNGKRSNRMAVAKDVLEAFIIGDDDQLKGRNADLISLISFARYPRVISPLTDSHDALVAMARHVQPPVRLDEDGTAIGDATALAAAQLREYEKSQGEDQEVRSKVIIMITDGENNAGQYSPMMAAALAEEWGIKIYTIFIGTQPEDMLDDDNEEVRVDWVLKAMAETTGGVYKRAYDYESLVAGYQAINELETSKLQTVVFTDRVPAYQPFALMALLFLMLSVLLSATWLRRLG
ncbi:VWA domain-containing protein [Endozoicomonas lisbonensis]|uniref:Ca-activated chloride channel family protein n=1 Tax=Endozoicomonas lisbonensis TaxID=3120522 RepID=A0ABV2SB35_9GAMM